MKASRRSFLKSGGYIAAGFLGVKRFIESPLCAQERRRGYQSEIETYGKLIEDPRRVLDLPEGFEYRVLSLTGDPMTDGLKTPGAPDGMAAFDAPGGKIVLVRNHELEDDKTYEGPFGLLNEKLCGVERDKLYDYGKGVRPQLGGTTNLLYNPVSRRVERQFLSLAGTARNCAGGPTPWNTWITCEETVDKAKDLREKDHGYNFEVPARAEMGLCDPVPLKDMGRFNHEAVAVDPASSIVYQTEDRDNGLITRFIPKERENLKAGGTLQALCVKGMESCDTRNWPDTGKPRLPIGEPLETTWMTLEETDNPEDKLRENGYKAGAARFARGEGMWHGNERVYFACTNGGIAKSGQIFYYVPSPHEGTEREAEQPGMLYLYLEPNNTHLLEYGDNLTVAPWGDVIVCEDGPNAQYLRGITPEGKMYTLARNMYSGNSEMAGSCFAPSHSTLFVNIQRPGITLAITGPWEALRSA